MYCSSNEHFSYKSTKVLDTAARPAIIQKNGLCFNCTSSAHGAAQCRSRGCRNCEGTHHTSICDRMKSTTSLFQDSRVQKSISALMNHASTLYPANRASKSGDRDSSGDVRFGSRKFSYLSIDNVTKLNLKPTRKEQRSIEQMFGTMRRNVEVYNVTMHLIQYDLINLICTHDPTSSKR